MKSPEKTTPLCSFLKITMGCKLTKGKKKEKRENQLGMTINTLEVLTLMIVVLGIFLNHY